MSISEAVILLLYQFYCFNARLAFLEFPQFYPQNYQSALLMIHNF